MNTRRSNTRSSNKIVRIQEVRSSQPSLLHGTLGQIFQYLEAPLGAKIDLNINKSDNWRHP